MPFSAAALQNAIDNKTKPPGSLGQIERIAAQIAALQKTLVPKMESCRLTIFAGDHGIAANGTSAYPQEVTRQMVLNFLGGGAAANVFARTLNVGVQVVDTGVAGEPISHPALLNRRLGAGTEDCSIRAAMTTAQFDGALEHGRGIADSERFDAVCFGEMGIGNTSSATLIFHKLFDLPLLELTGRGTGLDDDGLRRKADILRAAANRTPGKLSAADVMMEYGGFEIAMMTGAMLAAAKSGTLIIVDGFIASAAAATAMAMQATVRPAMIFAHTSAEQGHALALRALDAEPLLNLNMRLGEGTGALLAWPLIKSAAAMLTEMASFDSAGVSGPA